MRPDHIEQILDDAVYKVVWGDYKPKYEYLAEYAPGTMMDPDWDALEMFQLEMIALNARRHLDLDRLAK